MPSKFNKSNKVDLDFKVISEYDRDLQQDRAKPASVTPPIRTQANAQVHGNSSGGYPPTTTAGQSSHEENFPGLIPSKTLPQSVFPVIQASSGPSQTTLKIREHQERFDKRTQKAKEKLTKKTTPVGDCTQKLCLIEQRHLATPYKSSDRDRPNLIRTLEDKAVVGGAYSLSWKEDELLDTFYSAHRAPTATIPRLLGPECTSAICSGRVWEPHAAKAFSVNDQDRPKEIKMMEAKIQKARVQGASVEGWWENTILDLFYTIHYVKGSENGDKKQVNQNS